MKLWGWAGVVALALCTFAGAQEAKKETKGPTGVSAAMHKSFSGMEEEFVGAADAMPEDKYNYVPTQGEFKGVRDFASQVKHVASVHYILGAAITGEKPPADLVGEGENGPDSVKGKAAVMKYLKDSFAYAHKSLNAITDQNATEQMKSPFGPGQMTRLEMAVILVSHGFNHYGQMVEYLRLNGIVPPASRPRPQQQ